MRLLAIVEKPSLLRATLPHVAAKYGAFPHTEVVPLFTDPCHHLEPLVERPEGMEAAGRFAFPRGIRWAQFPFVGEVRYRQRQFEELLGEKGATGVRLFDREALLSSVPGGVPSQLHAAATSDFAIAIHDDGPSSAHAVHLTLESLKAQGVSFDRVDACAIRDTSRTALERLFLYPKDWFAVRDAAIEPSLVKRHFDYNYRINAFAVLGAAYAEACGPGDEGYDGRGLVASKHALQLLYALREIEEDCELTDTETMRLMANWRGTHRFPRHPEAFGSPASRWAIVTHLVRSGAVELKGSRLFVTALGERFLGRLHPDCQDFDQGPRLRHWMGLPFAEARPKIDRYIRTFFGKQRRRAMPYDPAAGRRSA